MVGTVKGFEGNQDCEPCSYNENLLSISIEMISLLYNFKKIYP